MTDLHRTVGGLLTRDPLLGTLLLNHAAALQGEQPPAPSLIVGSWADDDRPGAPADGELFTVDAHVSRDVLHPHRALAAVLDTVHAVLTGGPLAVERLTGTGVPNIGGGTVSRAATWAVAAVDADALGRPAADYRGSDAASSSR
jgi:hypothetical protein